MAVIGAILVFGAISTSDYYVLELHQPEPASVWTTLTIGLVLILPTVIHLIHKELRGNKQ